MMPIAQLGIDGRYKGQQGSARRWSRSCMRCLSWCFFIMMATIYMYFVGQLARWWVSLRWWWQVGWQGRAQGGKGNILGPLCLWQSFPPKPSIYPLLRNCGTFWYWPEWKANPTLQGCFFCQDRAACFYVVFIFGILSAGILLSRQFHTHLIPSIPSLPP